MAGWNGMSVAMDDTDVAKLRDVQGVRAVYPVLEVQMPEPGDVSPNDVHGNAMTGVDQLQQVDGLTGEGVTVAVIDSGIDYNNPDLGGSGVDDERADFPNDRVVGGYDLVGDDYDSNAGIPVAPDEFPDDCGGHGTHVAGIVGADGEVLGVAPGVDLLSYRVFGCDGSSSTDVILEAMERALEDGADVVNMSLGAAFATWQDYPTAQLADVLTAHGVSLVISAGNEGTAGTFSSRAPGVASEAITVASVEQHPSPLALRRGGGRGDRLQRGRRWRGSPDLGRAQPDLRRTRRHRGGAGLRSLGSPHGLRPRRGAAGRARRLLLPREGRRRSGRGLRRGDPLQQRPRRREPERRGRARDHHPGGPGRSGRRARAAGGARRRRRELGLAGGHRDPREPDRGPGLGVLLHGLTAELQLKPDVAAPGGSIWSTLPLELGGQGAKSGTSMAAPHVAGAAALMLETSPELTPGEVKAAMMSSADPMTWSLSPDAGYLEPVHRQGAGLLDMVGAVHGTTRVDEPTISLGEGENGPQTVTLTVSNDSATEQTYQVGVRHGIATGHPTYNPAFYEADGIAEPAADTVTVPAGGSTELSVILGEDFGADGIIYGGWITLTGAEDDIVVPFAGLSGDYQALPVLDDQGMGLPAMGVSDGADGVLLAPEGEHTYTMQNGDIPYLVYHFGYPVDRLEITAYTVKGGGKARPVNPSVGLIDAADHLGRSPQPEVYGWDGSYALKNQKTKTVKNGEYILEMRVLKPLGDPENPDHWETFTSPQFTIDDPKPGRPGAR